jgi:Uma2 family endonuclease
MPFPMDRQYTLEEYFSVEESSAIRHEFYQGQILAMAGAPLRHTRITGNVFSALHAAVSGSGCEVFASDLRVRTPGGLYTYPDVMVVCGGVELSQEDRLDTVVNPTAIIEVLSSSTAAYDRGEKFRLYQAFTTLHEYVLIEQAVPLVEHYWRQRSESIGPWSQQAYTGVDVEVPLKCFARTFPLSNIYAGVEFRERSRE